MCIFVLTSVFMALTMRLKEDVRGKPRKKVKEEPKEHTWVERY